MPIWDGRSFFGEKANVKTYSTDEHVDYGKGLVDVGIGNSSTNAKAARDAIVNETVRIHNGASDHVRLQSTDAASEWGVNVNNTTGDLRLQRVSGTGVVSFGVHASVTTETVSGYITIKDASGNTRKIAVVS